MNATLKKWEKRYQKLWYGIVSPRAPLHWLKGKDSTFDMATDLFVECFLLSQQNESLQAECKRLSEMLAAILVK